MDDALARRILIETCRRLYDRNLTVSAGGNMSVRLDGDRILITPSGKNKGLVRKEELAVVSMDGKVVSGPKPSIETGFHLALYRKNPDTNAVVHCHPLNCIAAVMRDGGLRTALTPEGVLLLGKVPVIPYITPGSQELVEAVGSNSDSPAMLMDRHGALTQGRSLEEAYNRMEELEFQARLQMLCGDVGDLPDDEVRRLEAMR